jgi:superfamily II DNA or RNA helicase
VTDSYPDIPVIGLTATPVRRDGTALGMVFDHLVLGADAETLMRDGYLAPYDYYAPRTVDMRTVRVRGAEFDMDDVTDVMLASRVYGDVLTYLDPSHKTIIYCPSVRFSMDLVNRLRDAGVTVEHFDGTTPTHERERIVDNFRTGNLRVMTNVDLVGEGFDVPDCDTVMLLRPTQSLALYIQQSMRAMRPRVGKRATVYDFVGNCYRHGMPTEPRAWSLDGRLVSPNPSAEPDILVRRCEGCHLVYGGVSAVCPYCGHDNGKTRRQIQVEHDTELARIETVKRIEAKRQQGRAKTLEELLAIEHERGYKRGWAHKIYYARRKKL